MPLTCGALTSPAYRPNVLDLRATRKRNLLAASQRFANQALDDGHPHSEIEQSFATAICIQPVQFCLFRFKPTTGSDRLPPATFHEQDRTP